MKGMAFLSGLLGVMVGLAAGMLMWGGGAPATAASETSLVRLDEVVSELRSISAQLAQQPARTEVVRDAQQQPVVPLEPSVSPGQLEALVSSIANLVAVIQASPVAGASGARSETVSPTAAENLAALHARLDRNALKRFDPELFGLSPREVYRKLGPPTWAEVRDGTVRWIYPGQGVLGDSLYVAFADGYVVWILRS